jgi:ubiquinone/menaquinone biosynthesis C-methylase UbiE
LGIDYSRPMLELARSQEPLVTVMQGDATALPLRDASVPVLVDGGALLHVRHWQAALAEYSRVAEAVVLHSVSVTRTHPTTNLRKRAYGHWVHEAVINEDELVDALRAVGLYPRQRQPSIHYDLGPIIGIPTSAQTWTCLRR